MDNIVNIDNSINNDIFNNYKQTLLEDYSAVLLKLSDIKMVNRTMVEFKCNCGTIINKQYRLVYSSGAYCIKCCYSNSIKKRKITLELLKNNNEYTILQKKLLDISKRDNCKIFNLKNANFNSQISFICNCGHDDLTTYRNIKIRGGFCRDCSYKYGCDKRKKHFMELYGTSSPASVPHIKDKIKNTNMIRYGVEYPAQNRFINNNTYKIKEYISKSGKNYQTQGYEYLALDELFKNYIESDIIFGKSNVPRINYTFNNTVKYYYPDIYIPKENKIIEIKSTWTYKVQIERNKSKANTCKLLGYKYEFWIYDNKKNKEIIYYY
jgi:hypothetical protein